MKKIILSLLLSILCLPTMLLYGCKETKTHQLDLSVYFENKVTYTVNNSSSKIDAKLNDFAHSKTDNQVQYTNITFTGNPAWLYKMTLEKIYSNANVDDFEFTIVVTNLSGAETTLTTSNTLTKDIPVKLEKNKTQTVTILINDIVDSATASTTIKLNFDSAYYKGDNASLDFKLDVLNFKVYGEHKR